MSHVTRTPLSRSKGRRSTCRERGILWRPPAQLVYEAVHGEGRRRVAVVCVTSCARGDTICLRPYRLSCSPFCRYHRLTLSVHAARIDRQSCSCVVSTHGKVEMRVIGVLVVVNTMVCDDISYRAAVRTANILRPEHIPLRNAYPTIIGYHTQL